MGLTRTRRFCFGRHHRTIANRFSHTRSAAYHPRRLGFEALEDRRLLSQAGTVLGVTEGAAPTIQITGVPDYGTSGNMTGKVSGVDYGQYRVAIYIQIEGSGWWTKPTFASPTVPINSDGTFSADVTTGLLDTRATLFYAAVIPAITTPPQASGAASLPVVSGSVASTSLERYGSTIEFAGRTWAVKESPMAVGPGSNLFSSSSQNVWVDSQGLHLKITNQGGQWYSAEVVCLDRLGFGTYSFQTQGRIDTLDPNVTFGFYTWDPYGGETNGAAANREIDFEDGRWGNPSDPTNAQMVIQPWNTAGNLHRYTIPTLTDTSTVTRAFTWGPGRVDFKAVLDSSPQTPIAEWAYGQDSASGHYVPDAGNAQIRLNLWLNNAAAGDDPPPEPANGQPVEVVISDFSFAPLDAAEAPFEPGRDSQPGFNLVSWWNFEADGPGKWSHAVQELYDNGYRCVSIVPVRYVNPTTGAITGGQKSPEIAAIAAGIAEARSLGMTVTVNPVVDLPEGSAGSRADLQFIGPAATEFFNDYRSYLSEVAAAAESFGATRMTIGSEWRTLTGDPAHNADWNRVIDTVAGLFHGSLGYAANWDEYQDPNLTATVWENQHISFIGVDLYPCLATTAEADGSGAYPDPTFISTVQANWMAALKGLHDFAQARKGGVGMPVVLTEVGLIPYNRTTTKPYQSSGTFDPVQEQDSAEQTNAFEALLRATEGTASWLPETYVWHWGMDGATGSDWYIHPGDALSHQTAQLLHDYVDVPAFEIEAVESPVPITEGRAATAAIRLHGTAPPVAPVTVTIARTAGDSDIIVDTTSATFDANNWRADAYVNLHALPDADAANGTATIVASAPGLSPVTIQATENDKDGSLGIALRQSAIAVREGRTGILQVNLTAEPKTPVIVTTAWTSGDAKVQVQAHGQIQFDSSNWDQPQWVALAAGTDADPFDGSAIFSVSAAGMTERQVMVTVKDTGPPGTPASYDALVDDYQTLPLQGETQSFSFYDRLGGDRGPMDDHGSVTFGRGYVEARVTGSTGWAGVWGSLNHAAAEGIPLNLAALLPQPIKADYQYRATGIWVEIEDGHGEFQLELKDPDGGLLWSHAATLSGGPQRLLVPLSNPPTNAQFLNWIVRGDAGSFVRVTRIGIAVQEVQGGKTGDLESFLWPYAWLLGNFDANTGFTRDRAEFPAGEFDAVNASGAQAALAAVASQLGIISAADALPIVTKTRDALLQLQRDNSVNGLLPRYVKRSSVLDTDYSTIDTLVGLGGVLLASQYLGLPTADVEQAIRNINWTALTLSDGTISHGCDRAGALLRDPETGDLLRWGTFGGESLLVALFYAASTGKTPTIHVNPTDPHTDNGSGFIDELPWLFVDTIGTDAWGVNWEAYRQSAADRQVAYFDRYSVPAFGLSAGEPPIPSQFPVAPDQTVAKPYMAYGIGGAAVAADDGSPMFNQPVVVPHYSGMVASLEGDSSRRMWDWMQDTGLVSPLNSVESLVVQQWGANLEIHYDALKGGWNSALQALGAARALNASLAAASRANAFVAAGLDTITAGPTPAIRIADSSGAADDGLILFTTDLSHYRSGAADSLLVRPEYPDNRQFVTVINNGTAPLVLSEIDVNAPHVTIDHPLTSDPSDDLTLQPGQSQKFHLTYAPVSPAGNGATETFDRADGLVIVSNAPNAPSLQVALTGNSTFDADISYDGKVNLGELGPLNVNFGRKRGVDPAYDPTADINGDGRINLSDLGLLNKQFGWSRPAAIAAVAFDNALSKAVSPAAAAALLATAGGPESLADPSAERTEETLKLLAAGWVC